MTRRLILRPILRPILLAALPGCMFPGCTLIDQTTFNPAAGKPPVIPAAPVAAAPAPGPPPLLVLHPGQPAGEAVRQAVAAARSRKPDVAFDVVAMVPDSPAAAGSAAGQAPGQAPAQTPSWSEEAGAVARAITAEGVPPGRVHLFARPEAGLSGQEVRVYVR